MESTSSLFPWPTVTRAHPKARLLKAKANNSRRASSKVKVKVKAKVNNKVKANSSHLVSSKAKVSNLLRANLLRASNLLKVKIPLQTSLKDSEHPKDKPQQANNLLKAKLHLLLSLQALPNRKPLVLPLPLPHLHQQLLHPPLPLQLHLHQRKLLHQSRDRLLLQYRKAAFLFPWPGSI
jgi:hypothetical protein